MVRFRLKKGRHLPLRFALPDKRTISPRPQSEGKGIKQNGFSGSRFTG